MGHSSALSPEKQELVAQQINAIEEAISDDDFQYDFFLSIQDQFEAKQWLSEKQLASLERMYDRIAK